MAGSAGLVSDLGSGPSAVPRCLMPSPVSRLSSDAGAGSICHCCSAATAATGAVSDWHSSSNRPSSHAARPRINAAGRGGTGSVMAGGVVGIGNNGMNPRDSAAELSAVAAAGHPADQGALASAGCWLPALPALSSYSSSSSAWILAAISFTFTWRTSRPLTR